MANAISTPHQKFRMENETCGIDTRMLDRISAEFAAKLGEIGMVPADCIAVAGEGNFENAIAVVSLLARGQNFYLTAQNSMTEYPLFCRGRVVFRTEYPYIGVERIHADQEIKPTDRLQTSHLARMYLRSSGSTGVAKIVSFTHQNLIGNSRNCINRFELTSRARVAVTVPVTHMFGLGAALIPAVLAGASVDLQTSSNVLKFLDREKHFEPTMAFMPPSFAVGLVKGRRGSRSYRLTVTAGDRMNPRYFDDYEARFGPIVQLYGSTEMGAVAAGNIDDPVETRKYTVGRALPGVSLRVSENRSGRMRCRHPFGFEGYADNDLGTIVEKPGEWFDTSDVAEIRPDGSIYVIGRADNAANRDGYLLLFSEIETAIENIDGVESAVVASRGSSDRGAFIVAKCVLSEPGGKTGAELRSMCMQWLPKHLVPDEVEIWRSFPVMPNGKFDRRSIADMTELDLD